MSSIKTKTHKRTKTPKEKIPKKVKSYVGKAINRSSETYYMYGGGEATPSTTTTFRLLNGCTQGDAVGNRSGDEIKCTSVLIDVQINQKYVDATHLYGKYPSTVRCMLVVDKQPNKAIFAITDLLVDETLHAMRNYQQRKRFHVLYDKLITYTPPNSAMPTAAQTVTIKEFKIRKNLKNLKTEYAGNAGTVADITKNSVYFLYFTDDTYEANNYPPVYDINARLFYKE